MPEVKSSVETIAHVVISVSVKKTDAVMMISATAVSDKSEQQVSH